MKLSGLLSWPMKWQVLHWWTIESPPKEGNSLFPLPPHIFFLQKYYVPSFLSCLPNYSILPTKISKKTMVNFSPNWKTRHAFFLFLQRSSFFIIFQNFSMLIICECTIFSKHKFPSCFSSLIFYNYHYHCWKEFPRVLA